MVREVLEVSYQRRDGLQTSSLLALNADYAGELVRVLLGAGSQSVVAVTVTRRPPMPGEVPNA